jgi:hypothetical protein
MASMTRQFRMLLTLEHDAELETGEHEHHRAVDQPKSGRLAPDFSVAFWLFAHLAGGRAWEREDQSEHHQRAKRGRQADDEGRRGPSRSSAEGGKASEPVRGGVQSGTEEEAQQGHCSQPGESPGSRRWRRVFGDKRRHHGDHGGDEEAGRAP